MCSGLQLNAVLCELGCVSVSTSYETDLSWLVNVNCDSFSSPKNS